MYNIVERLAILEGRITPQTDTAITESRQKKPALFNNLRRTDEMFSPGVSGVEFAEDAVEEDVLSKVKNSLADYLKSTENKIKQDKDLIKKEKQDLDLKKKEMQKDRALQFKPDTHLQDVDEDPSQGTAGQASAGLSAPTYAESRITAPVKTVHIPVGEEVGLSGGGGSTLVEIHGDERDGFCIKCAGKELRSRFKSLAECEIALEMYMAHRKAKHENSGSADYIEEA